MNPKDLATSRTSPSPGPSSSTNAWTVPGYSLSSSNTPIQVLRRTSSGSPQMGRKMSTDGYEPGCHAATRDTCASRSKLRPAKLMGRLTA